MELLFLWSLLPLYATCSCTYVRKYAGNAEFAHELLITSTKSDNQSSCLSAILSEYIAIAVKHHFEKLTELPIGNSQLEVTLTYYDQFQMPNTITEKSMDLRFLAIIFFENMLIKSHFNVIRVWTGTVQFLEDEVFAYRSTISKSRIFGKQSTMLLHVQGITEDGKHFVTCDYKEHAVPDLKVGSSLVIPGSRIMVGLVDSIDPQKHNIKFVIVNAQRYPELINYADIYYPPTRVTWKAMLLP